MLGHPTLGARDLFSAIHNVVGHIHTRKSTTIVRCRTAFSGTVLASLTIARTRLRRNITLIDRRLGTTVSLTGGGVRAFRTSRHFIKRGMRAVRKIVY